MKRQIIIENCKDCPYSFIGGGLLRMNTKYEKNFCSLIYKETNEKAIKELADPWVLLKMPPEVPKKGIHSLCPLEIIPKSGLKQFFGTKGSEREQA